MGSSLSLDSLKSTKVSNDCNSLLKLAPDKLYLLQFDGGSRGNPGLAGTGMVLFDTESDLEVWSGCEFLKHKATNNVAEYMGLVRGLECALFMGVKRVTVEGDSELIVKQIKGIYKVRNAGLKDLYTQVLTLIASFKSFSIAHIPREENGRADKLANEAMDLCKSLNLDCVSSFDDVSTSKEFSYDDTMGVPNTDL